MAARIVSRIEFRHRWALQPLHSLMTKTPMARLFHVPLSPFCRKVRLSLAEKKIEVELVEERYWEKDADFMRRNPAAKVPVLRLDNKLMAESAAICASRHSRCRQVSRSGRAASPASTMETSWSGA